jgi:hypothetical protein
VLFIYLSKYPIGMNQYIENIVNSVYTRFNSFLFLTSWLFTLSLSLFFSSSLLSPRLICLSILLPSHLIPSRLLCLAILLSSPLSTPFSSSSHPIHLSIKSFLSIQSKWVLYNTTQQHNDNNVNLANADTTTQSNSMLDN